MEGANPGRILGSAIDTCLFIAGEASLHGTNLSHAGERIERLLAQLNRDRWYCTSQVPNDRRVSPLPLTSFALEAKVQLCRA